MDSLPSSSPYLPFQNLQSLSSVQIQSIHYSIHILWQKTLMPLQEIQFDSTKVLKKNGTTSTLLNSIQVFVEVTIPHLSLTNRGSDFLLNREIDRHVNRLNEGITALKALQARIDVIATALRTTDPLISVYTTPLDEIGKDYGSLNLATIDQEYITLLLKIQTRIKLYTNKKISINSQQLIVNIFDFDMPYLQNNIEQFKNSTNEFNSKLEEATKAKATFDSIRNAFDKDFNRLNYFIKNNCTYTTLNNMAFNASYSAGNCQALKSYAPQLTAMVYKDPLFEIPDESVVMDILTTLVIKSLVIEGNHLPPCPSTHPAFLLAHCWTPCFNDGKEQRDQKLMAEVKALSTKITTADHAFQGFITLFQQFIEQPPKLRTDLCPEGDKMYKEMNAVLISIANDFIRLSEALNQRIAQQVKPTISETALKIVTCSLDIPLHTLKEKMENYQSNTEKCKNLLSQLNESRDAMNNHIVQFKNLLQTSIQYYDSQLEYSFINDWWLWLNGSPQNTKN